MIHPRGRDICRIHAGEKIVHPFPLRKVWIPFVLERAIHTSIVLGESVPGCKFVNHTSGFSWLIICE